MRHFLYITLIDRLSRLTGEAGEPVIRTFDLWNEQIEYIEQEETFAVPAIFIEFRPLEWTTLGGSTQRAEATIRLHIVTQWNGSARQGSFCQRQSLERFDLLDRIDHHLFNLQADNGNVSVNAFRRAASSTNHNHEELVEDISDYTCMVVEKI